MKATEILRNDHDVIKELLERYHAMEPGEAAEKNTVFNQARREIEAHTQIEEEIFYPAVRESHTPDAERLVREAFEEHRVVKKMFKELEDKKIGSVDFDATFKVIKENVLHHAKEEEKDIFAQANQYLSAKELEDLGREMAARKNQLGGKLHESRGVMMKARRVLSRAKRFVSTTFGGRRTTSSRGRSRGARSRAKRR